MVVHLGSRHGLRDHRHWLPTVRRQLVRRDRRRGGERENNIHIPFLPLALLAAQGHPLLHRLPTEQVLRELKVGPRDAVVHGKIALVEHLHKHAVDPPRKITAEDFVPPRALRAVIVRWGLVDGVSDPHPTVRVHPGEAVVLVEFGLGNGDFEPAQGVFDGTVDCLRGVCQWS